MPIQRYALALVGTMISTVVVVFPQTPSSPGASIVGAWTLNKDLSDQSPGPDRGERPEGGGRRDGGGRRGGFGGGFGGRGFGGGAAHNPEGNRRMRDALREELQAPDHLTIVQTDAMVIITAGDGRTTRLSTDSKKIKDESTGIERKTKWDDGKLVSEINGLGPAKVTETYAVDADQKQLHVVVQVDGPRRTSANRVYDRDER